MANYSKFDIVRIAAAASARSTDATRHKCFVSYHVDDIDEVAAFLDTFGSEFIPRTIGVTSDDDFINSDNDEYIKQRIGTKYLSDSTVTIVLLGKCTWGRKFVDWEISSSLRNDPVNKRNGLLALPLPSMNNSARLSDRMKDNRTEGDAASSYLVYHSYPKATAGLRSSISTAFNARTEKSQYINNSRALRRANAPCP